MKYDEYIVLFFVDVIVLNFQPPNAPYGGIFYKELLHEKVNVLGTVGMGYYKVKAELANIEDSEKGLGMRLGTGIQYDLTENVALRSMVRYVKLNSFESMDDMVEVTAGLRFSF